MSGAVKSVKKVFKSVTKSPVGKMAVSAAVAYFTAGLGAQVIGATSFASSISPAMGTVLSHAISGAVAGGITSAVTGDKIGKGLALGAAGGAVMGGVQALRGDYTPGFGPTETSRAIESYSSAAGPGQNTGVNTAGETGMLQKNYWGDSVLTEGIPAARYEPAAGPKNYWGDSVLTEGIPAATARNDDFGIWAGEFSGTSPRGPAATARNYVTGGGTGPAAGSYRAAQEAGVVGGDSGGNSLLDSAGKWIKDHQTVAGLAAAGAFQAGGSALGSMAEADAARETARMKQEAEDRRIADIRASYGGTGGLLRPEAVAATRAAQGPRPTPDQRFDPRTYGGRFVYNRETGKVEFVPNAAA